MSDSLLERLAQIYAGDNIRYPSLKAITLAQWMLESGRATSDLATLHYNFGGLKWRPEMALFATRILYEAHDGLDAYCKFATIENFLAGYWAFIGRAPYSGWETHVDTPEDYIRFIGPIYTPRAGYADDVLRLTGEAQKLLSDSPRVTLATNTVRDNIGTIILDPGHGGTFKVGGSSPNNAVSLSGVKEKKLTLDFCFILRDRIMAQADQAGLDVKVMMTRTTDVNVGIAERAAFASKNGAKAFICLHFNGLDKQSVRGAETYFADAAHGNLNLDEDKAFAAEIHDGWMAGLRKIDPAAVDRKLKPESDSGPGGLGVINDIALGNNKRAKKCVGAYMEAEFITNPTVENLLISGPDAISNRNAALNVLAGIIVEYMRKH